MSLRARRISFIVVVWTLLQFESFAASPNANDDFANAIGLEGSSNHVTAKFTGPTIEPNEPLQTNNIQGTLWWSWTAPAEGRTLVTPNVVPVGTNNLYSKFEVYAGPSLDQLTKVGYRPWYPDGPVIFRALAGVTYYIQTWARENNSGEQSDFFIELFPFGPAVNDNFADAVDIEASGAFTPRSVIGATYELGEPVHRTEGPTKTLWWKYRAVSNSKAAVVMRGFGTLTNFTTAVYLGDSVENLRLVGKGDGLVQFEAWALETYHIAVAVPPLDVGDVAIGLSESEGDRIPFTHEYSSNLVVNPSFETLGGNSFQGWSGRFGGGAINNGGPDGANFAFLNTDAVWQDIPTIPGESYRVQFVYINGQDFDSFITVKFGGGAIKLTLPSTNQSWHAADLGFKPTNSVTRLEFKGGIYTIGLDQVVVRRINTTGPKFISSETNDPGEIRFYLQAAGPFRCVIDRKIDSGAWQPFQILDSSQSLTAFSDDLTASSIRMYRARLLDP